MHRIAAAVFLTLLIATMLPFAASAADRDAVERQFQQWLATDVWSEAQSAGVSRAAFERALAGVTLDWDLPELVPPGAQPSPPKVEWQSEFGSPGNYFGEKTPAALASGGRARLDRWRSALAGIEQQYGVPAKILVAIWGKESAFGEVAIPKSAIRVLATQGFMGARKETFRPELIAALQIVQRGDIAPERMRSSWAGALGQPQFLPSVFLRHAVDFDADGRRDIWDSVPDTLASIANYLRSEGWNPTRGWGLEVSVPGEIACYLEGPEQGKSMEEWARLGVVPMDGSAFPVRADRLGYLLMPAGRHGPAFIVTENFYVLKEYNYSDLYALYIGHLADRFADNSRMRAGWEKVGGFSRGDVRNMQDQLVAEGHDVGRADGLVGFKTRIAVGLWQARKGKQPTCFPDAGLIRNIH
jgi:lytic murein transglycosylase